MKTVSALLLGLLLIAPGLQASEASKPKTEEELKEQAANTTQDQDAYIQVLIKAACSGDIPMARAALAVVRMETFPENREHPLFCTSNPEMLQLLITHKSDVNRRSFNLNSTVLMDRCNS